MSSKRLVPLCSLEMDSDDSSQGSIDCPSRSYRHSNTRDLRHMSIKPSLSKKRSRDKFQDESSVSSSDSQDSMSKGDRKPAAE